MGRRAERSECHWAVVAFHAAHVPFVYFGVEDHPDYHRPTDDVARINPAFYGASATLILRAIVALDAGF